MDITFVTFSASPVFTDKQLKTAAKYQVNWKDHRVQDCILYKIGQQQKEKCIENSGIII
jgi:hypothetical protein